ncbi:molybdopterin-dependent oxidoreductase [Roseateles sp. BYS180W]|uniref:Molybdopterin-dependent oxidoreductase n=1 Tax=Roseateles rivi TaxID=3299028 RepID=A0ABW7FU52_9BURK
MHSPPTLSTQTSLCRMCHGGCGVKVQLQDGQITALEGDSSNPFTHGFFCVKGKASLELLNHPDRLEQPLRRVGHSHQVLGWDEALDLAAEQLQRVIQAHGPEAVVLAQGTDRNYQEWVFRLANAMGTPNVLGPAHVCFYPRLMAAVLSCGGFTFCDYASTPEVVLLWGSNKLLTHSDGVIGTQLAQALRQGSELMVIDPYPTELARRAALWLQPRPGSDAALALGFLHLVVTQGWYDADFVRQHTEGFEPLVAHLAPYTPAHVAELTGIAPDVLERAARRYALARSACIEAGTGVSQHPQAFATLRSITMLSALCGHLDAPGGDVIWEPMAVDGRRSFPAAALLAPEQARKRLGAAEHPVLGMSGWAHPNAVWRAMRQQQPYAVRALLGFGSNLLTTYANAREVHAALQGLDFHLSCELFMTPTARLADLVLPVGSWLERDQIVEFNAYIGARQKLAQRGQCRSDEDIILGLAERLGLQRHFWPSLEQALDHKLRGEGLSWAQLKAEGLKPNRLRYRKYQSEGFKTRSGKFALFHGGLPHMGGEALPSFRAPPPLQAGEFWLSSRHSTYFYNSEFRQLDSLRQREPWPLLEIHPEAAAAQGLHEGQWVRVSRGQRSVQLRLALRAGLARDVVYAAPSWWDPADPSAQSWQRHNLNLLTDDEDCGAEMGSSQFRGFAVRLHPLTDEEAPHAASPHS